MRLTDWIEQAVEANMPADAVATRSFYATQLEGAGTTVWKFQTAAERDAWVAQRTHRAAIPAADARRMIERPSPGHYTRWGKPEFAR